MSQRDFEDGTVIIDEPNTLVQLSSDIVFNPKSDWINSPNEEGAYFCEAMDADVFEGCDKTHGSFRLGFFAAISIEADNVTLDLNNHILAVDEEFLLQQRFFTLIGVGQGPFLKGQGPASFGGDVNINITNIKIRNGELGLSPHHGIHGNLVNDIEIFNLKIYDFEVAGIQLNGFTNAYLHDIEIGPSLTRVPVVGRYSQARFGLLSFRDIKERLEQLSYNELNSNYIVNFLNAGEDGSDGSLNVVEIMERLIEGMDLYFDYKINGVIPSNNDKELRKLWREAVSLFDNDSGGFPDGSALYGILLNSAGDAINWFGARSSAMSENVVLENIIIKDLNLKVKEVVAYINSAGSVVTGPFKGALSMNLLQDLDSFDPDTFDLSRDSYQNYHGNLLADAQIALAMFADYFEELEGTTIDQEFINWALGVGNLTNGRLVCNGDDMFHMDKGVVGIRIDRTNNLKMRDVTIENINNWSEFGSEFCATPNNNSNNSNNSYPFYYSAHPQTPSESSSINYKYQGRVARGVALTDVIGDIILENIEIDAVNSVRGSAIGIDLLGTEASIVYLDGDIILDDIVAGAELIKRNEKWVITDEAFPNNNVFACGLYITNPNGDFIVDSSDGGYFRDNTELNIVDVDGPAICLGSVDWSSA